MTRITLNPDGTCTLQSFSYFGAGDGEAAFCAVVDKLEESNEQARAEWESIAPDERERRTKAFSREKRRMEKLSEWGSGYLFEYWWAGLDAAERAKWVSLTGSDDRVQAWLAYRDADDYEPAPNDPTGEQRQNEARLLRDEEARERLAWLLMNERTNPHKEESTK